MSKIPVAHIGKTATLAEHQWQVVRAVNGNLEFGPNIKSTVPLSLATPGVANTEFTIDHNLGYVPNGYIIIGKDKTCDVYDSRRNQWSTSQIFLKCTAATVQLVLIVL